MIGLCLPLVYDLNAWQLVWSSTAWAALSIRRGH